MSYESTPLNEVWYCIPERVADKAILTSCRALLSRSENDRMERFVFAEDRHRFLVSHAMLRLVLSRYTDVSPTELRFVHNEHGKPELSGPSDLHFNLTHTKGLCALVVADVDCGLDVEVHRRSNDLMAVAQRMFAPDELDGFCGDELQDRSLFFRLWTLREAYVKALGTGLSGSSKSFWFETETGLPPRLTGMSNEGNEGWYFDMLELSDVHTAALALRSETPRTIRISRFDPEAFLP